MVTPVVIGDAGSLGRAIQPTDYATGWRTTGTPDQAVSLDTWQDLFETSLRSVLTAIITVDAPTGITLQDLQIEAPITLKLDFMVGGQAAELSVDLSTLYQTSEPADIALDGAPGNIDGLTHPDHAHGLPSRAAGNTPIIALDHLAAAPPAGHGMRLRFNATTGVPEYAPEVVGASLGTATPEPVGGTPAPGGGPDSAPEDHVHGIAADSVGLAELAPAPSVADYGRYLGFDPTTGVSAVLDAGGGTFLSQTDTPASFGVTGQVPEINGAADALVFGGPYQPLAAPADPTNLRATDAFDMSLEMQFNAVAGADHYEWQRRAAGGSWPSAAPAMVNNTTVRVTALALGNYDFRVRAVSPNGHLQSGWVEVLNIPLIATPTPAASASNVLTRVRSQTLHYEWDNLDVDNGGVGAARVVKAAAYEFQYKEQTLANWPALTANSASVGADIAGLTNGTLYETRVRGSATRSDGTGTNVVGAWSPASNAQKPVKDAVTLTYGVAATRTGAITSPRTVEVTPGTGNGSVIEITNAANPAVAGEYFVLDVSRGLEYDRDFNITALETRPLPTDITAGASFVAEANPPTGPRRYSVGPATAISSIQVWYVELV